MNRTIPPTKIASTWPRSARRGVPGSGAGRGVRSGGEPARWVIGQSVGLRDITVLSEIVMFDMLPPKKPRTLPMAVWRR